MTAKKKFNFKAPLEVFAKSIVQPMMYLSVAGILLIVGIILTNKTICALVPVLGSGPFQLVGAVVYQSLMFIINNLSILFCVGIAGAMAKKNKGHASLIALMSFFLFLQANNIVLNATGSLADASGMLGLTGTGQATVMGIQVLDTGVFGGIILGCITGAVFNKYSNKHPHCPFDVLGRSLPVPDHDHHLLDHGRWLLHRLASGSGCHLLRRRHH